MEAAVGDRLHIHGHNVGDPGRTGEIVEVRGSAGEPPYLVRFEDGHTRLVFPGPDAVVERVRRASTRKAAPRAKTAGRGKGGAAGAGAKSGAARKKGGR
jgi:hypothetical protein